jgi:hypothetical protein
MPPESNDTELAEAVRRATPEDRDLLRQFAPTGKTGRNIATGLPAWEYESLDEPGRRGWLRADGVFTDD